MPKRKHQDKRWFKLLRTVKPRLMAQSDLRCPRCGQPILPGQKVDLGHASRDPAVAFDPAFLRIEHSSCNRRDGQRITTAKRKRPNLGARLGKW